jgi:ATP-dependent Clp protease ATP-binding subunit ClpC
VSFRADGANQPEAAVVTGEIVARVVTEWTGIPVEGLTRESQSRLQDMAALLRRRVIGQDEAIERVVRVVKAARAGLRDKRRPSGVFLLLGPTGVGKTELCKALAEFLFGSERELIRLDMSEYMEKHSVSRLIGAPPGYVGHDQEGELTGKLRNKPYSVVLLDEIEKAHPEVFDLFLQLFDEGRLTDSHGRTVDGKNAIYMMTSNISLTPHGARAIGFGAEKSQNPKEESSDYLVEELKKAFRPEFLNRIDEVIVFRALDRTDIEKITRKLLDQLAKLALEQSIVVEFSDDVARLVRAEGFSPEHGARYLARTMERLVSRRLSELLISGDLHPGEQIRGEVENGKVVFHPVDSDQAPPETS